MTLKDVSMPMRRKPIPVGGANNRATRGHDTNCKCANHKFLSLLAAKLTARLQSFANDCYGS